MDSISPDTEDAQAITEPAQVKSEETPKIEVVKKPRSEAQKAALEKARLNATAARAEKAAAKKILKDPEPEAEEEEIEYVTRKKKPVKRRIVVVEASSDEEEEEIEVRLPKKRQPIAPAPDTAKKVVDPRLDARMYKMFGSL